MESKTYRVVVIGPSYRETIGEGLTERKAERVESGVLRQGVAEGHYVMIEEES